MRFRRTFGFTLVELLVSIGVIAILAAMVVAVSSGVLMRGDRGQVESAFRCLDQAITAHEQVSGRPLGFSRRLAVPAASGQEDGMRFADVEELPPNFVNEAYIMPRLLAVLAADAQAWASLSAISPDMLRREQGRRWPDGTVTDWNLRDPWGGQIAVVPCGRPATRGELKDARDRVRRGLSTAGADPLGIGIDLADGTVRTADERAVGRVCSGRQWLFISTGPDGRGGWSPDAAAWADNIFSHEPARVGP